MTTETLIALIVFGASQFADAYTTVKLLERGGRELIPAVRWLMSRFGVKTGLAIKVAFSCAVAGLMIDLGYTWLVFVMAAGFVALAANNHRLER